MQILKESPSLRNYLTPKIGSCFLQISLISDSQEVLEKSNFPFLEATQSDPLQRLIKGKFITEADSEIREVFLLVQRDHYLLKNDELWPITNASIDQSWQKALINHWQKASSIFLSKPVDEKNELIAPWEPLFFCKKQKLFFPNLCPFCGKVWHLCQEDDLLAEFKLPAYSQSLERYLYCPSCFQQGKIEFYTYASNHAHPHFVKDRFALISALPNLFSSAIPDDLFPCKACPYQLECFGGKNWAQTRIIPFSFYPFYMIIFKAGSLNAQDFVFLIGGAKEKELQEDLQIKQEMGRKESLKTFFGERDQQTNHLFFNKDNFFGEVLYLKLSFLNGVIQKLWSGNNFANYPESRLSLDRIWVDLPSTSGFLPTFWNFEVEIMDVFHSIAHSPFSDLLLAETYYFLGQLWFYTLLVNKKQKVSQVYSALGKAREFIPKAESFSFVEFSPVFRPENIFWNPDNHKVPAPFLSFWEEALKLGWSLLMWSLPEKSPSSLSYFLDKLIKLREEIKDYIFQVQVAETKGASVKEDIAIRQILKKLLAELTKAEQFPMEEVTETVVLTPGQFKKEVTPPAVTEETPETAIISPEDYKKIKDSPAPEFEEEAIQTVILHADSKPQKKPLISPTRPADEEAAQTVILTTQPQHPDDLGQETVIITPGSKLSTEREKPSAKKLAKEEIAEVHPARSKEIEEKKEDLLSETVIIQPKRTSEKGRYGGKK